ncbi:hypothetical protein ACVIG9_003503 [Bradyrhizobium ottawaense]
MHDARPRLRLGRVGAFRRRRDQGLDHLVPKARDPRAAHVAADHPVGQARLKRLVDDAAAPSEIRLAARHQLVEPDVLGPAPALGMEYTNRLVRVRKRFDLPDALAAIAAILLEHARAVRAKARGKFGAERRGAVIAMRVGAPAEVTRAVEHLLDAHLQDHVGMGAHPRSLRRDVAQQGIELGARLALVDRIDPDQHAVSREQLVADCVGKAFVVDHGVRVDAEGGEGLEDADEAAVLRRRVAARGGIAA